LEARRARLSRHLVGPDHALDVTTGCFLLERSSLAAQDGSIPSITSPSKHDEQQCQSSTQVSDSECHDCDMLWVCTMSFHFASVSGPTEPLYLPIYRYVCKLVSLQYTRLPARACT
jgi:hypothetical protein